MTLTQDIAAKLKEYVDKRFCLVLGLEAYEQLKRELGDRTVKVVESDGMTGMRSYMQVMGVRIYKSRELAPGDVAFVPLPDPFEPFLPPNHECYRGFLDDELELVE